MKPEPSSLVFQPSATPALHVPPTSCLAHLLPRPPPASPTSCLAHLLPHPTPSTPHTHPSQVQYGYIALEEIFRDSSHMSVSELGWLLGAKIAATALCVGGGLVGGLFAPSLFIGECPRCCASQPAGGSAGAGGAGRAVARSSGLPSARARRRLAKRGAAAGFAADACLPAFAGALVGDIIGHFFASQWGLVDPTSLVVVGAAATLGAACRAPLTAVALMVGRLAGSSSCARVHLPGCYPGSTRDRCSGRCSRTADARQQLAASKQPAGRAHGLLARC
jgi:hypothetical protein